MKLLNKLLPITFISIIPTVGFQLSSCSKSGVTDLNYVPTVAQHDEAQFNDSSAVTEEYFNKVAENGEILVQDYIWSRIQNVNTWLNTQSEYETNKHANVMFDAKNISVSKKSLESKDYYVLSGSFSEKQNRTYTTKSKVDDKEVTSNVDTNSNVSYVIKNVSFYLSKNTDAWTISLSLVNNFDWEVRESRTDSSYVVSNTPDGTKISSSHSSRDTVYDKYSSSYMPFANFNSYYLKKVTLK